MKYLKRALIITTVLNSSLTNAEDFKKIFDNTTQSVKEVCSTDSDGSVNVATRCHYDLIDIPFIAYAADPKIKRKATEVTDIISPVHNIFKRKDAVYVVFQHALAEVSYDMADGRSNLTVFQPSDDTLKKYGFGTSWLAKTTSLSKEVPEFGGFKVGDRFCLNKPPSEGFPVGIPVKITHLFNNENYAVVDSVSSGFLGFGNVINFHFTDFASLVACSDKPSLDPAKSINTSAPVVQEDLSINTLHSEKDAVLPVENAPIAPQQSTPAVTK